LRICQISIDKGIHEYAGGHHAWGVRARWPKPVAISAVLSSNGFCPF
jgi:hypothetical protein